MRKYLRILQAAFPLSICQPNYQIQNLVHVKLAVQKVVGFRSCTMHVVAAVSQFFITKIDCLSIYNLSFRKQD